MKNSREKIREFIDKCDQLRSSKFIMATTHIKEMLMGIAASEELYELFSEVTKNFDYISSKRQCFTVSGEGFAQRWKMVLPEQPADMLAFVFCLLAEFDRGSINFNDFLQRYFPQDGSYSSSFRSFCTAVILPFENIIKQLFEELPEQTETKAAATPASPNAEAARRNSVISLVISQERSVIQNSSMSDGDKRDGLAMLDGLEDALKGGRQSEAEAILRGYDYYSVCHGDFSQLTQQLAALAED